MKRKAVERDSAAVDGENRKSQKQKQATEGDELREHFGPGLFEPDTINLNTTAYTDSEPYRHGVVSNLMDDSLLRSVRKEILDNIHFTSKETDIYKIHQSGDLANLDGLDASALKKLPSLRKLRDALYSYDFRKWLSTVTGAGPLSGTKTDMAVNVYVPGCHLLCHDDVIGTRRVSYILYLLDPDTPWKAEWGGALRLYPTDEKEDGSGKVFKIPRPEWSTVIRPAWNQLAFFAVAPGESFHDVEEVYKPAETDNDKDGARVRMAISGWFHIPQEGEEGFEPGLEKKLKENSSLHQLQGKADQFDLPQIQWHVPRSSSHDTEHESDDLAADDFEFLLQYMTPSYLTPDTVEQLQDLFDEEPVHHLSNFLKPEFAGRLREWLSSDQIATWQLRFNTSTPPHKNRYQYMYSTPSVGNAVDNPFELLLHDLLPSLAFRKWLSAATGLSLKRTGAIARRFRRRLDYQLAQTYQNDDPQLEYCLCVTPTTGWGGDEQTAEVDGQDNGTSRRAADEEDSVGGYEMYMAGEEDDDDDENEDGSEDGVEVPQKMQSSTGAGERRSAKRNKADPAVYKALEESEDDGILVQSAACWNTLTIVLRDKGTQKFVKYVSASAPGDRWDLTGIAEVEDDDEVG